MARRQSTTNKERVMSHPVVWFEVLGTDGDKLRRFYADLFGWKIDANNPMQYGMVDTGTKQGIPGGVAAAAKGMRPGVTFYVAADDLQASLARAERLGGKTVLPPLQLPDGPAIAMFSDP